MSEYGLSKSASYWKRTAVTCRTFKSEAIGENPVAALAHASEITGLPRDNFEIHEISKEEFERLRFP